ncbi:uncharacterized protein CC84DRAFT_1191148 [Paraphaeosphaeria sporulosa]|uniref:Protein SQS1 n=1 Tax=Paraphaeosphaeria sporulosa TaxID=1460663 RepID=A0A177BZ48_9PLEO|nr:uncharacterized protein CC84DRAFT_1191148 [Paraphaeosphaeria sporulosa]OAF99807.1 hypothetical protein CC84DRAFT_1191148 [Paraphaeosphaeria sporulosa]
MACVAVSAETQPFSLRDEARYMSSHRSSAFDSTKKLRHMPIAFVSAGCLEGTVKEKPPPVDSTHGPASPSLPQSPVATVALAQMTIRSPSPALSAASSGASSEELIVFRGRGHTPLTQNESPSLPKKADTAPTVVSLTIQSTHGAMMSHLQPDSLPHGQSDIDSDTNSVVDSHFERRRGGRARWEGISAEWVSRSKPGIGWLPSNERPDMDAFVKGEVDPRDAALDDYLQNAEAFGLTGEMLGFAAGRELDLDAGSHNDWESEEEPEIPPQLEQDENDGWTSDLARDLDVLSTSDDVEGIVAHVTGRRTRPHGVQYQVVYEGCTRDDARWLPVAFLTTPSDKFLIEAYEAQRLAREQQQMSSSSDSDPEFNIDGDSSEEQDDMDDEQLARALQKQEELGIDDSDLILYGADEFFRGPVSTTSRASRTTFDRPNKRRQQRAGGGRRTEHLFPSASAMADALGMDPYNGFDIMDTERPSLKIKKKGRRGQLPPELDDPDLNEQLQASWDADRRKKRLKKAEREELRKQGLLGRKDKTPNLSVKYKDGFVMEDVMEEIRDFWATDMATLSLPAMEAHRRAVIHQFVGEFGINSKSQGDGAKRHTVLSKTVRTLQFDDDLFDSTLAQKKYTRRLHAVSSYPPQKKKEKGTKTRPTVSYKDGEVVGAKAPELGAENKGRAMLEKMGWSKGMALGAMDNKGILQPITHTVKITKAGLR